MLTGTYNSLNLIDSGEKKNEMTNSKLELAYKFVNYTAENIFLTGKAGTGKTTFLHEIRRKALKRSVVVAPTGVAAINAGGVTIHSFFQLPFGPILPGSTGNQRQGGKTSFFKKFNKEKINIIKSLDLLIIDEISMVRADMLDGIDEVLRRYRRRPEPFGGVQLLMIGDLEQLAPVVKEDEWSLLRAYYENAFFFSSRALKKTSYVSIVLDRVYRQSDTEFIGILNKVRNKNLDSAALQKLNSRYIPGFISEENEGYIILTTHNAQARNINQERLDTLPEKSTVFRAEVSGDFPEHSYPTEPLLELKPGSQVMFVKNDPSKAKKYFNGKIGIIEEIEEDTVFIKCEGEEDIIDVSPAEWENIKYSIDKGSKEISEKVCGSFVQLPLKHAWAITVHKSQGLTFDKAIIDVSASFAHGQVYVALSRCKSLQGMVLNKPIDPSTLINNTEITSFIKDAEDNPPDESGFNSAKKAFIQGLLNELFDYQEINNELNVLKRNIDSFSQLVTGNLKLIHKEVYPGFSKDIFSVANRFHPRIAQLMAEDTDPLNNSKLQKKIAAATKYFIEKNREILLNHLDSLQFDTDNQEIQKVLQSSIDTIERLTTFKCLCMETCLEGFKLSHFLEVKAKALIEETVSKPTKKDKIKESKPDDIRNPKLYSRLISWRNKTAEENSKAHYMVLQLKTLVTLANYAPQTLEELKKVKGMGKKKIESYGNELLSIIQESGADNKLSEAEIKDSEKDKKKKEIVKKERKPTAEISYEMFKSGMTTQEIARKRDLAVSTIEGHLARKVGEGLIDIAELVEENKISKMEKYFKNADSDSLKDAKEALGEEISYSELHYMKKTLQKKADN